MDRDLAKYMLHYYAHLMTQKERLASRHLQGKLKIAHSASPALKERLSEFLSSDPDVLELVAGGIDAFAERTAERIMATHGKEIFLNRCPRCGKLAKTPKARQCRFCHHDWHTA